MCVLILFLLYLTNALQSVYRWGSPGGLSTSVQYGNADHHWWHHVEECQRVTRPIRTSNGASDKGQQVTQLSQRNRATLHIRDAITHKTRTKFSFTNVCFLHFSYFDLNDFQNFRIGLLSEFVFTKLVNSLIDAMPIKQVLISLNLKRSNDSLRAPRSSTLLQIDR